MLRNVEIGDRTYVNNFEILNEVLSLNAQEFPVAALRKVKWCSSMKS